MSGAGAVDLVPEEIESVLRAECRADLQRWIGKGEFHEALAYLESGDGLPLGIPEWAKLPEWDIRACSRTSGRVGVIVVARRADELEVVQEYEGPKIRGAIPMADDRRPILHWMLTRNLGTMRALDAARELDGKPLLV